MTHSSGGDAVPVDAQGAQVDERRAVQRFAEKPQSGIRHVAAGEVDALEVATVEVEKGPTELVDAACKEQVVCTRGKAIGYAASRGSGAPACSRGRDR